MGNFKSVVVVDVASESLADVVNTAMRRYGWDGIFVNDALHTVTGNLSKSENIMGKVWHYRFRVVVRWLAMEDFTKAAGSEQKLICKMTDGEVLPVDTNTSWTEEELAKLRSGTALEIFVEEDTYTWTKEECKKKFDQLIRGVWEDSRLLVSASKNQNRRGARWAEEDELKQAGYKQVQRNDRCLIIACEGAEFLQLTEADTNRHALVCGPTGTGKTTGIFVPNLIERTGVSAIVTEATGSKGRADLYQKTAGYRAANGHVIYYFNPDDLRSERINPLDRVKTYRDARRVTEIIMQSTTVQTHRGDQTWDMAERLLLTALILHSVGERDDGNCNLGYVLKLLNKGADELKCILQESQIEEAREAYQGFLNNSTEAYRNLVAGGLITRLDLWKDPRIRALTEETDVEYEEMPEQLFTWYMATPADKPELKPLAALVFNIALDIVGNSNFRHGVALFLDEFTNFGYVRGMPQKLTIIRHDKIPAVLGIQDYIQLENLYQKEAPLFFSQPGTRIFFRPNDQQTAERISKGLGVVEETRRKITSAGQIHDERDKYPLLSLDELLNLDPSKLVAFTPKTRPVLKTALNWQDYANETNAESYPVPPKGELIVDEELTRRDKSKVNKESKKKSKRKAVELAEERVKPEANTKAVESLQPQISTNPLIWSKEIRIEWPSNTGYQPKTYGPHTDLKELSLLAYAFENKDPDARKYMTLADYARLCDWLKARETSEVIDILPSEVKDPAQADVNESNKTTCDEANSSVSDQEETKKGNSDHGASSVTQDLESKEKEDREEASRDDDDDNFMGAWG